MEFLWRQWKFCINCGDLLDLTHTFIFTPTKQHTFRVSAYISSLQQLFAFVYIHSYIQQDVRIRKRINRKRSHCRCSPVYFWHIDMWTIMMFIMYAKLDGWSGWMDGAYWCPGSLKTGWCKDEMGSGVEWRVHQLILRYDLKHQQYKQKNGLGEEKNDN